MSLLPVKKMTEKILNEEINFLEINNEAKKIISESDNKIFMLENLRFDPGEEVNSKDYKNSWHHLPMFILMKHFLVRTVRMHQSMLTQFLESYAGSSIINEVEALEKVFKL